MLTREMTSLELEHILHDVAAGNLQEIDRLGVSGQLDEISSEDKALLTRTAAQSGRAEMLRHLFEYYHLYATDPDAWGRTVLHFAAMSGDADTVRFTIEVLGFDPLSGDVDGLTALDYARQASKPNAYQWMTDYLGFTLDDAYRNPILRGCYPDPSIVRAGEDYYIVNSSFVLFPGLPISHSRDLIHWQTIGHAAENLEWSGLQGLPGGFGYWAPDISYHQGRFWVVATLRRNAPPYRLQMITSAADPRGPWDQPRFLPLDGIDPSLFVDDDGRRYILLNPGAILAEIDEAGNLISAPEMISFGSTRIKPEGPHLLKKDGWYYLFLAEGGTGSGHMETVMRSQKLRGPYQPCPFNPILGRKDPLSPIQRSGHGKPVMLPDGRWMMVYLCSRPVEGKTIMGRETALDYLSWTKDGWPMVNALRGPSCLQKKPLPNQEIFNHQSNDWVSPRADYRDFAKFDRNRIHMKCGTDPASASPTSLLLHRQTEATFSQTVWVSMKDAQDDSLAGLSGYYDEHSFFIFGIRKKGSLCQLELLEQLGDTKQIIALMVLTDVSAALMIKGDGFLRRFFVNGKEICTVRTEYLCDEGGFGGKRFTGAMLGICAIGSGCAVFYNYRIEMLVPGKYI